jgi:hypothetical protein
MLLGPLQLEQDARRYLMQFQELKTVSDCHFVFRRSVQFPLNCA